LDLTFSLKVAFDYKNYTLAGTLGFIYIDRINARTDVPFAPMVLVASQCDECKYIRKDWKIGKD
jgi:hypothetical protein